MKDIGITKSILSMSSPGTHLFPGDDQQARKLTRDVNEYMSEVCTKHKQYFQFFASLPLPDVEGSLAEIDYALDNLGAVGFQIMTNSHGIYPGDPRLSRVFDKLSDRNTIVFFHPTSCNLERGDGLVEHVNPMAGVPSPLMEFMFDTTRALTSLFTSGTVTRCPGITFVICHCGATFPPIVVRQTVSSFPRPTINFIHESLRAYEFRSLKRVSNRHELRNFLPFSSKMERH